MAAHYSLEGKLFTSSNPHTHKTGQGESRRRRRIRRGEFMGAIRLVSKREYRLCPLERILWKEATSWDELGGRS